MRALEHQALINKDPSLKQQKEKLSHLALGTRRCMALRHLAVSLAIPKLKHGPALFAASAPKPRIGNFTPTLGEKTTVDIETLKKDRQYANSPGRPIDWLDDPMPLDHEINIHRAYTELITLTICHNMPAAFYDLGMLYDQNHSTLNSYFLYGLFHHAIKNRCTSHDRPSSSDR